MLQFMGSQRVRHGRAIELTKNNKVNPIFHFFCKQKLNEIKNWNKVFQRTT